MNQLATSVGTRKMCRVLWPLLLAALIIIVVGVGLAAQEENGMIPISVCAVDTEGSELSSATVTLHALGGAVWTATGSGTWSVVEGASAQFGGRWGGLDSGNSAYMTMEGGRTIRMIALSGEITTLITPGTNRIEIVFEPIQVSGVTLDLDGNPLAGKVSYDVQKYPWVTAEAPCSWTMANGGVVSRYARWGGLRSAESGYTRIFKDTTYTTDALTGAMTETFTPGVTRLEFMFESIQVHGVALDPEGNLLAGDVSYDVQKYPWVTAEAPCSWTMANGGAVSRYARWGGLKSPESGYTRIFKDATYTTDALTGAMTETFTSGVTRVEFVFDVMTITVTTTDGLGLPIPGETYFEYHPHWPSAQFGPSPSVGEMANGGLGVYGGRWDGIERKASAYLRLFRDETLHIDAVSGATTVMETPGRQGIEVRFSLNQPPTADGGADRILEAASAGGADAVLDGSASTDDGALQPLAFDWSWNGGSATGVGPTVFLPLGENVVALTVDDGEYTDTDTVLITVQDTTPPDVSCPGELVLNVDDPDAEATYVAWLLAATATDICDPAVCLSHDAPLFSEISVEGADGVGTVVTWTAMDASGNSGTCSSIVKLLDTAPPELTVTLTPDILWPANHKLVSITAVVAAVDNHDSAPAVWLVSIQSNEPDEARGVGDGSTRADIRDALPGTADFGFSLRAERQGASNGRIYTITYCATDVCGNVACVSREVIVPHRAPK